MCLRDFFVLVATGFGLAPVSFGTSLILSAVGGLMCAGGGATAAGSSIAESKIFKSKLAEAQALIDADREAQKPVEKLLNELYREVSKVSFDSFKDHISYNANVVLLVKNQKNLVDAGKCAKAGARVATIASSEGVEAVLRSIGIAGNVARIGVFAISAAFLPFDIYTMVTSAMEVDCHRKGKEDKLTRCSQETKTACR